jgi:hypothetical protein
MCDSSLFAPQAVDSDRGGLFIPNRPAAIKANRKDLEDLQELLIQA